MLYVGHAGHDEATGTLAVAPDAIRLVEHEEDLAGVLTTVADPSKVALLAQTTLSMHDWEGIADRARTEFPELWTATRNDLCFATTNRQAAVQGQIAMEADAIVVIGSAELRRTPSPSPRWPRRPAARSCCASTAPTSSPASENLAPRSATLPSSASPRARAHPRISCKAGDRCAKHRADV